MTLDHDDVGSNPTASATNIKLLQQRTIMLRWYKSLTSQDKEWIKIAFWTLVLIVIIPAFLILRPKLEQMYYCYMRAIC